MLERLGDAHRADVRRPDFPFPQGRGALAANARKQNEGTEATSADFSYRFLIGSGRADSARNGGGRGFAQPGRVVVDAMRAREPG